jgi:hypothetical protein
MHAGGLAAIKISRLAIRHLTAKFVISPCCCGSPGCRGQINSAGDGD